MSDLAQLVQALNGLTWPGAIGLAALVLLGIAIIVAIVIWWISILP